MFTALAVSREVKARTGRALRNVLPQARPLRSANIAINDTTHTFPPAILADKEAIPHALRRRQNHTLSDCAKSGRSYFMKLLSRLQDTNRESPGASSHVDRERNVTGAAELILARYGS